MFICLLLVLLGCSSQKEEEESSDAYEVMDDENDIVDWSYDEKTGEESVELLYTYSLSDINTLDGVFRLNADQNSVTQIIGDLRSGNGVGICEYDGNKVDMWLGYGVTPTDINRANGEKLVLVGSEWANLSENDKEAGERPISRLELIGYGNFSMLSDRSRTEILDIQNIDISTINADEKAVNDVLSSTGLSYHTYYEIGDMFRPRDLLLSDQYGMNVTLSYYEGTQYSTIDIAMADSYYLKPRTITDDIPRVSVQQTKEGYFILDISGLSSGLYALESYSGSYVINII